MEHGGEERPRIDGAQDVVNQISIRPDPTRPDNSSGRRCLGHDSHMNSIHGGSARASLGREGRLSGVLACSYCRDLFPRLPSAAGWSSTQPGSIS